ncbi:MFS transporter [Vagococcus carniphilus]|uniref:MFS transporter n=1 Tax=Vagococcus carniphilus TaxID=218144 RepID=UPI002890472B|nr:MFS transporter [Vagococcus carniphilus]MDT2829544.1 MFS transporter [Vagococcus carniphilus]MDT2839003.1 MFS transporter [Vagococcus carniphilus]MDT2853061.1 MFS transporter [Vagococcus carniphilus]
METKKFHVNLAVLATGMMAFAGVLIETAMNVTFPTLIEQFGITTSQVQWVTTIYLLMISIVVPLSSYLMKNYSKRQLFIASSLFFVAGVLVDAFAFSFTVLLVGRLLQGVATGIALPLMFNIILTKVPIKKRGMMIGIGNLTTSIAPAMGPTYGGILTTTYDWTYIYKLLIPVLIVSTVIGLYAIPKEEQQKTDTINMKAALYLSVMFTGLLFFFSHLESPIGWISLAIGLVGGFLFYGSNKQKELLNLSVFSNKMFTVYLISFLVYQILLLGVSFVLPNFIQIVSDVPASRAGVMMFPGALTGALFAPISGKILDKLGFKKPIGIGILFAVAGWMSLIFVIQTGNMTLITMSHVIFMIGVGLSYSNVMTVGLSAIDKSLQDDGNAVFSTLQQFMGAVSTSFVAIIVGLFQKSSSDYQQGTSTGSKVALICLFILLVISGLSVFKTFTKKEIQQ